MVHPDTRLEFINDHIGYGVVATRLIPAGTITWAKDDFDQTFSTAQVKKMNSIYREIVDKYCYIDIKGDFVLCWDLARYFNHSCDASCRGAGYDFEIAVRDIHPGEELTDDYGSLNDHCNFECSCGSPICREKILPSDLVQYSKEWDQIVAAPFRQISAVPQPLWPFVQEKKEVEEALAGRSPILTCQAQYFPHPGAGNIKPTKSSDK